MKRIAVVVFAVLISAVHSNSHAMTCNCEDWMGKGGYCVDYIKDRIPKFPIPYKDDMPSLKNTDVADVTEGDVAVFIVENFWHVAYVEKVHRSRRGEATAIDVSEMNFGDELSFREFKEKWRSNSKYEWSRAVCCGITENYDRVTLRKNIDVDTIKQVWSPDDVPSDGGARLSVNAIVLKVRAAINRLFPSLTTDL